MSANGADAYRVRRSRSMAAVRADAAIQPNEWNPGRREGGEGAGVCMRVAGKGSWRRGTESASEGEAQRQWRQQNESDGVEEEEQSSAEQSSSGRECELAECNFVKRHRRAESASLKRLKRSKRQLWL